MSLDEKFLSIRTVWYQIVETFFKKIAGLLGYPKNPGMPTVSNLPDELYSRAKFLDTLPVHASNWGRQPQPTTWLEMVFGASPKVDNVLKIPFESEKDGFVSFSIQNYQNIYFLPDWLSEFLQVRLNLCSDITLLETIREVLFVGLVIYSQIVILRISLSWFISINPYSFPWCYVAAAVDWTEDILQGLIPSVLGVNITGTVFLGILGVMADSLNHLVFTMPYLPSEGLETKARLNQYQGETDVIMFRGFPNLWQRYPIPNEIREFWYHQRKDIFDYYINQGVQVLPDSVLQQLNQQKLKADLPQMYDAFINKNYSLSDISSTQVLSNNDLGQGYEWIPYINSMNQHFYDFWITQLNNLV